MFITRVVLKLYGGERRNETFVGEPMAFSRIFVSLVVTRVFLFNRPIAQLMPEYNFIFDDTAKRDCFDGEPTALAGFLLFVLLVARPQGRGARDLEVLMFATKHCAAHCAESQCDASATNCEAAATNCEAPPGVSAAQGLSLRARAVRA